jgi:hypothetical protein|tara:strand:+ start:1764 stop:1970 length:207 start_codon:yes stop_codon:yes gene_type:complete
MGARRGFRVLIRRRARTVDGAIRTADMPSRGMSAEVRLARMGHRRARAIERRERDRDRDRDARCSDLN